MAHYMSEPSRTFSEYLLIPGYTSENCIPSRPEPKQVIMRMYFLTVTLGCLYTSGQH